MVCRDVHSGLVGPALRCGLLYAAELIVWLLAILARSASGRACNVGSEESVSGKRLAEIISAALPSRPVIEVAGRTDTSNPVNHYVPNVERARTELGLDVKIPLADSISRTISWLERGTR